MTRPYGPLRKISDAALLIGLSLGALYVGARLTLAPSDMTRGAAVIFAPWTNADRTLVRATADGASFVRYGGLPFIAVVAASDPDYPARMLDAGAWLVIDPKFLAACSAVFNGPENS